MYDKQILTSTFSEMNKIKAKIKLLFAAVKFAVLTIQDWYVKNYFETAG